MKIPRLKLSVKNLTLHALSISVVGEGPVMNEQGQYEQIEIVVAEPGKEGSERSGPVSVWFREASELRGEDGT